MAKAKAKAKGKSKAKKKDPEEIRKKLLADPNTEKIAQKLKVTTDQYINLVVKFAMNPNLEPHLLMVSDDNLRKMGHEPPDANAMARHINEAVAVATAVKGTGYADPKKAPVALPQTPPLRADPRETVPELDEEVTHRRKGPSSKS